MPASLVCSFPLSFQCNSSEKVVGSGPAPDGNINWCRRVPSGMKGFCGRKKTLEGAGVRMRPVAEDHRPGSMLA